MYSDKAFYLFNKKHCVFNISEKEKKSFKNNPNQKYIYSEKKKSILYCFGFNRGVRGEG